MANTSKLPLHLLSIMKKGMRVKVSDVIKFYAEHPYKENLQLWIWN